jgi:hypothetical protein
MTETDESLRSSPSQPCKDQDFCTALISHLEEDEIMGEKRGDAERDDRLALAVLHRHWLAADSIKYHLRRSMKAEPEKEIGLPQELAQAGQMQSAFFALGTSYALLWVVVEGYRELNLTDDRIDGLLEREDLVDALRRFRNATFHYQRDPLGDKIMTFLTAADSEVWVDDLHKSFDHFFNERLALKDVIAGLKDTSR